MNTHNTSRRNFLKSAGLTGTALCLGFYFPSSAKSPGKADKFEVEEGNIEMNAWIHIDTKGKVTIMDHRAEMGQGSYQSVPQIIAEELEVDLKNKNFYSYKLPRIADIPPIEVHIMENDADAGGVGEPGLPAFAPALTNAVFDLTGKRIRKLPFALSVTRGKDQNI